MPWKDLACLSTRKQRAKRWVRKDMLVNMGTLALKKFWVLGILLQKLSVSSEFWESMKSKFYSVHRGRKKVVCPCCIITCVELIPPLCHPMIKDCMPLVRCIRVLYLLEGFLSHSLCAPPARTASIILHNLAWLCRRPWQLTLYLERC